MLVCIDSLYKDFVLVFNQAGLAEFLAQKQPRSAKKREANFQSFIYSLGNDRRESVKFTTQLEKIDEEWRKRVATQSISLEELLATPFGQQLETILIGEAKCKHYVETLGHTHDYKVRQGKLFAQIWPYLLQYLWATTSLELTYNSSLNESSKETIEKIRQDVRAVARQFSASVQHIAVGHDQQVEFQANGHRSVASAHLRDYFGEVDVVDLPQIAAMPS